MRTFNVHKMFIFQSSSVPSVPGLVPCVLCIHFLLKSRSDLSNAEICVLCDLLGCICPSVLLVDGLGSVTIPVSAVCSCIRCVCTDCWKDWSVYFFSVLLRMVELLPGLQWFDLGCVPYVVLPSLSLLV